jgi:hypothetical protein
MKTNRDFYKAIETLIYERKGKPGVSLEHYLSSFRSRAAQWQHQSELSLDTVYALLEDSFSPAGEAAAAEGEIEENAEGFAGWDSVVRRQIQDLLAMKKNGRLEDEQRYFGIEAPSGQQWYNFDPCTYIECGAAGAFGGWEEGDQTGRKYVTGHVAVSTEDGGIDLRDARDLDQPPKELGSISWEQFRDFLWCGQQYE